MKFTRYGHRNDGKRYFFLASWKIWNNSPTLAYCIILSYLSIQEKHCGPWQKNFVLFLSEVYFWAFLPPRMGYRMSLKVVYFCKSLPRPLLSDRSLAFACSSLDPLFPSVCHEIYYFSFGPFIKFDVLNRSTWFKIKRYNRWYSDKSPSALSAIFPVPRFALPPQASTVLGVLCIFPGFFIHTQPKMNIDPPPPFYITGIMYSSNFFLT